MHGVIGRPLGSGNSSPGTDHRAGGGASRKTLPAHRSCRRHGAGASHLPGSDDRGPDLIPSVRKTGSMFTPPRPSPQVG